MNCRITQVGCGYRGHTLLQFLMALVILSVLTGVLAPDAGWLRSDKQGEAMLRQVAAVIALARVEAARSGYMATLCPSGDGLQCGAQWHDGILLYLDRDDDRMPGDGDELVQYLRFENAAGTLHWRAFRSKPYLQITPLGFTRYQNGNFTWCDVKKTPRSARQLILNHTGRVRFSRDYDGDGLRENSQGRPIRCPA